MPSKEKPVIILSETLPLGGTSTFVMNLCGGMEGREDWRCVAAGLRGLNEVGAQIRAAGHEILSPGAGVVLHEERIEELHRNCAAMGARAVVAGLGSGAFDFLRYVPEGVVRVGMIQSDDDCVYDLVERYLPWLDIVVGVSSEICRKMRERAVPERVSVVAQPYGVPMPDGPPEPRPEGPLRVLYLGRVLEDQKRVGLMSRVMRRTLEANPALTWTIAGDGADLPAMKEMFRDIPDRVDFLGSVPYAEVPSLLPRHDLYFLCSDYEGLPLSLLEAMGAGLVPVVSDLPSGISEVVNESNGIRVPIHDEAAYVEAVLQLAKDRSSLSAMSVRASAQVRESHSTRAMAARWATMLDAHLPANTPLWPTRCRATAPMELDGQWQFSPAMRPVRRLLKRLKR